jgi:hypothetical protein
MVELSSTKCGSCNASVYWLRNDKTKRWAPIDVDPVPDGSVTIHVEGGHTVYHVLTNEEKATGRYPERFENHFYTCVHADQHRKEQR